MLKGGAERRLQLDAAFRSGHDRAQRETVAKREFSLPATIQGKPWTQLSMNIAGTDPAESGVIQGLQLPCVAMHNTCVRTLTHVVDSAADAE